VIPTDIFAINVLTEAQVFVSLAQLVKIEAQVSPRFALVVFVTEVVGFEMFVIILS